MAQKQIPEYTDSQLIREIARVTARPSSTIIDLNASNAYFDELLDERDRREKIYGHALRHSQGVTFDVPRGSRLNVERVA